jgi:hypothetical protein
VPPGSFESGTLSLIRNYLDALSGAYTYKIYYPEDK